METSPLDENLREEIKLCLRCLKYKPLSAFHKTYNKCRMCQSKATKKFNRVNSRWVGFRAVHDRLNKLNGKAAYYDCICGEKAVDWSLDHTTPMEELLVDVHTICEGMIFSLNPDNYMPKCKRCNSLDGSTKNSPLARRLLELGRTSWPIVWNDDGTYSAVYPEL